MSTTPQDFAILGAGSIGCYLGGHLIAAGAPTTLLGRERIQKALQKNGLTLTHYERAPIELPWEQLRYTIAPEEALAQAKYVLLTVKSQDTLSAAEQIRTHAPASAIVISFQNGVRNASVLREALPSHTILAGMVPYNVLHQSPGHFHCGTGGYLEIEEKPGISDPILAQMRQAQLEIEANPKLEAVMWTKLLMNMSNAVNALVGVPLKEGLAQRVYRKSLALCAEEALGILRLAGIKPARVGRVLPSLLPGVLRLPNWLFKVLAASMLKIDPKARSSMWQDLDDRKRTEIDYLNGEIVALAKERGTEAPVNAMMIELIRKAEEAGEGSPGIAPEALWQKLSAARSR